MVCIEGQSSLEEKKGGWVPDENPKVQSEIKFIHLEKGDSVDGIYKKKKPNSKFPDNMIYYIEDKEGNQISGVSGSVDLDLWMEKRKEGELIKIECVGEEDVGKAKPMKKFKVYHWE